MTVQKAPGSTPGALIIPPPDVREILEKTATFVGEKPALEAEILKRHESEPRFSFLKPSDPYHAFYKAKVIEARSGSGSGTPDDNSKTTGKDVDENGTVGEEQDGAIEQAKTTTKQRKAVVSVLKTARAKSEASRPEPQEPPPDDIFTLADANPGMMALTLDVMKLTAQYAAANGSDFLTSLGNKELRNPLFDFLKPMHPHFIVFQRLVDAYSAILGVTRDSELFAKLKVQSESEDSILDDVWYLHDWECQKAEREHEAEMEESEKLKVAQIDWHDFVVLETIELDDDGEDLPAPIADARQLPKILAAAQKAKLEREKNRGDVDMEIDVEMGTETDPKVIPSKGGDAVTVDADSDIPSDLIRTNEKASTSTVSEHSKQQVQAQEATYVLPSGQRVPMSKVEASMRAELLNPSYKDERARAAEKNRQQNLAGGEEMARNLARWDQAHTERGVFNRGDLQGELSALPKPSGEEADKRMKKATALGPQLPADTDTDGKLSPPSKRAKLEAAVDALSKIAKNVEEVTEVVAAESMPETLPGLVSADEWMAKQGNTAKITVKVCTHSNKDWNLAGQEIVMVVPLKGTVGKLKAALAKSNSTKLPANKQKLQYDKVGFLKDKMSLAYYNVENGAVIVLEVKERGGRKRH